MQPRVCTALQGNNTVSSARSYGTGGTGPGGGYPSRIPRYKSKSRGQSADMDRGVTELSNQGHNRYNPFGLRRFIRNQAVGVAATPANDPISTARGRAQMKTEKRDRCGSRQFNWSLDL